MIRRVLVSFLTLLACVTPDAARGQGRAIQAQDGDFVHVPADATITVVRVLPGHIRTRLHGNMLIVLLDQGPQPDGIVDYYHRFELTEPFAREHLWDGPGALERYEALGNFGGPATLAIVIPQGRIFFGLGPPGGRVPPIADFIAAYSFRGGGGGRARATFEDAEREALGGRSSTGLRASVQVIPPSVAGGVVMDPADAPAGAPVRVGGNIRAPTKVKDVPPVMPDVARQAGIHGVVILEVTIDAQGKITNARVLRSIPQLDQAALDAVRQWEYTPTYLNGVPVPVIMTVPVPFGSQTP